ALLFFFFFSSRRRHTRFSRDWSSDVCSSDLFIPSGVIALSLSSAPPVSAIVGWPERRLTTPMSRQKTPRRMPVPSALAQASLARSEERRVGKERRNRQWLGRQGNQ